MSQNMLVERLKFAKRELTALKTAHRRGLGLLKVYTETYVFNNPSTTSWSYWLTLELNFSISAYPFVRFIQAVNSGASVPEMAEVEFKNSGNSLVYRVPMAFLSGSGNRFSLKVYSTSPIQSYTYSWEPWT